MPTAENVRRLARRVAPDARAVHVDNAPLIPTHARALLTSGPQGATDYIDADFKDPARILEGAAKTLDLDRPVALVLVALLRFIEDDEAYPVVREPMDALPSGSRLVLSHLAEDLDPPNIRAVQEAHTKRGFTFVLRSRAEAAEAACPAGLDAIERIRYADINDVTDADINVYAVTGRKA